MRTGIASAAMAGWLLLVLGPVAAALEPNEAPQLVDDVADAAGIENPLQLNTVPDEGASGSGDESPSMAKQVAQAAPAALAPVKLAADGLLALGLQLIAWLLTGLSQGTQTLVAAAHVVAAQPVASLQIAAATLLVVGVVGFTALGLQRYGSFGAIPLFTRIAKSQLLDNPVRNQVFELVRSNPGLNVSEIGRRLDIAWGTTTHHLQKLRAERLVAIRIQGNQKCYFPNGGTFTGAEMDLMSATKHPTARRIARHLAGAGPRSHGEISTELGISPALLSFHMDRLVRAGVVARQRAGRRTIFHPLVVDLDPQPRPATHL